MILSLSNPRFSDYALKGKLFVAVGKRVDPYVFDKDDAIATRLRELADPDESTLESRVVAFYETFGFLGDDSPAALRSESSWYAHEHGKNIELILRLRKARGRELEQVLARVSRKDQGEGIAYAIDGEMAGLEHGLKNVAGMSGPEQVAEARAIAHEVLNSNLQFGLNVALTQDDGFELRASSLMSAIYWSVAVDLGGGYLGICKECKQPFLSSRSRPYCPPWPGKKNSRCQRRFNRG